MNRGDELARNMTIREVMAMEMMGANISNPRIEGDWILFAQDSVNAVDALLAELERTTDAD